MGQARRETVEAPDPRPAAHPERLGDYRILREVGRGGMGVVYEAEQVSLGRRVALKVLPQKLLLDTRSRQRFEREARSAARLHHTNIVPVYGAGEHDGLPYYVMQFIPGLGLDKVLDELKALPAGGPAPADPPTGGATAGRPSLVPADLARSLLTGEFHPGDDSGSGAGAAPWDSATVAEPVSGADGPPADAPARPSSSAVLPGQSGGTTEARWTYWRGVAHVGVQVADALAHAHGQGILHRDVKPSNLLLDAQGTVWVTDFGLAKAMADTGDLTHTGDIIGTLRYMAPERFGGGGDARSDLYSLGLTLYELLTLRPAFGESDRNKLMKQVMQDEPPRPRKVNAAVPRDLETVVLKCLVHDPAKRYPTAADLADDLRRFLDDKPIRARRVSQLERSWLWCKRNPLVATLLLALFLVVAAGVGGIAWKWREAAANAARAGANAEAAQGNARAAAASARESQEALEKAEANFAMALGAVDRYLDRVTDNPRLQEPDLTPLRRQLLESAREFYQKFVSERGDDPRARHSLARAHLKLCALASNLEGDQDRALELARRALPLFEQLESDHPGEADPLRDLAKCDREIAVVLARLNRPQESEAAWERATDYQGRVVELTDAAEDRGLLASFHFTRGQARAAAAAWDRAETHFAECVRLWERLTAEDANDRESRFELAHSQSWHACALINLGRAPESAREYARAESLCRELVAAQPDNDGYRHLLADTILVRTLNVRKDDDPKEVRRDLLTAISQEVLALEKRPAYGVYRDALRRIYGALADVALRLGDYDGAAEAAATAGGIDLNDASAAFETIDRLYRSAAVAARAPHLAPADRQTAARAILGRAESFLGVAASHTPAAPADQDRLARWLVTSPAAPAGQVSRALDLARQATRARPLERGFWTTVGMAYYRADNWAAARLALEYSSRLSGATAADWLFLAMTYWQLGEPERARTCHGKALAGMKANPAADVDLPRFREEADVLLGYAAPPAASSWAVVVDADLAGFNKWLASMDAADYRPTFVNVHGRGGQGRYSAVAVTNAQNRAWRVRTDKGSYEFQRRFEQQMAGEYWVTSLSGCALGDTAGYVSLWEKMSAADGMCRHIIPADGFRQEAGQQRGQGLRPLSVSAFAYGDGYRLTTVYGPSRGKAWELRDGLSAEQLQAARDDWRARGRRPACVYVYPDDGQTRFGVVLLQDGAAARWEARPGLTAAEFTRENERLTKEGYHPEQVVGYEQGGEGRFVGVWLRDRPPAPVPNRPMTGRTVPELAALDRAMQTYMKERNISAGSLAVMKDGKLVFSRGYGHADREGKTPVAPDELFRLASVSKPITAAAVRKLFRDGKLKPEDRVWDLLRLAPPPGRTADPRWKDVTVQHLLDHRGGWDRDQAGDPMFQPLEIAKALGKAGPATADDVVAYMAGQPLQFDPGSKSVYSNFGYCLLGRVIEKVTGRSYIDYVRAEVLAPAGITRIAQGRTLPTDRDPKEPVYVGEGTGPNVMKPGQKELVPTPDGTFHLEAMDAHGGLIGPADELVRFLATYQIDGRPVEKKPSAGAFFGAFPGSFTMLYQRSDGVAVAALFNQWQDAEGHDPFEIRRLIDQAVESIKEWPK